MNGERVNFDEMSLLEFSGVSVLQYTNTSKYSAIFNSGISVTVEGQQELLGLVTLMPTIFKGKILLLFLVDSFSDVCFTALKLHQRNAINSNLFQLRLTTVRFHILRFIRLRTMKLGVTIIFTASRPSKSELTGSIFVSMKASCDNISQIVT